MTTACAGETEGDDRHLNRVGTIMLQQALAPWSLLYLESLIEFWRSLAAQFRLLESKGYAKPYYMIQAEEAASK